MKKKKDGSEDEQDRRKVYQDRRQEEQDGLQNEQDRRQVEQAELAQRQSLYSLLTVICPQY